VVRGYAGTAAAAHNSGAAVISSYHLHPGIVSFMAGTYNEVTSDHVTIDLAFEGDEYEANSNGSKANDVYGLYFLKLHFQKAAPQNGANLLGNGPLRLSMSPIGGKKALPRKGLVSLYDFFQHNGNVNYPISQPADLITNDKCTPGQTFGPVRSNWVVGGYAFNSSDGYQPRLVSGSNHPLTGDGGWTEFVVFNPTAVGQSNIVRHGCFAQGQATMLYMGLPSAGAISYEGSNGGARSAGGVVSAGNWYVFAVTKSPGPINTTAKLYLNGASVAIGTAATNTPNVSAGPLQFGTNGNTTVSGCGGCSCNYQDGFSGTVAGYGAYNRVLNPTEIKQVCNALKSYYGRPPRNITLTCN